MIAAATEDNYYRQDYDPSTVVVKDMAKAVVIHYVFLQSRFEPWLVTILCLFWNFG